MGESEPTMGVERSDVSRETSIPGWWRESIASQLRKMVV